VQIITDDTAYIESRSGSENMRVSRKDNCDFVLSSGLNDDVFGIINFKKWTRRYRIERRGVRFMGESGAFCYRDRS
jgi:hypothetical protein